MGGYILIILGWLLIPLIIIVTIIIFILRRLGFSKGSNDKNDSKNNYLQLSFSKEDTVSQYLFLLSLFFFGLTLSAFNKDFGNIFSWQTLVLITSLIGFVTAYYFKIIYTLAFSIIGLISWYGIQSSIWLDNVKSKSLLPVLIGLSYIFLLLFVIGRIHEKYPKFKRFSLMYLIMGIIAITGFLFFFSSKIGLSALDSLQRGYVIAISWQVFAGFSIIFVFLMGSLSYAVISKLISYYEAAALITLIILFGSFILLSDQSLITNSSANRMDYFSYDRPLSSTGIIWAVILNIVVFFENLGIIFLGLLKKEEWLINLGAFFLFILIIIKYFDWFFTFLDKSIFFIGAGILLFVVGWGMERGRRYMITNIKSGSELQKT